MSDTKPARLDPTGTAEPLTKIVTHVRIGDAFHGTVNSGIEPQYVAEDGERTALGDHKRIAWKYALRNMRHALLEAGVDNAKAEALSHGVSKAVDERIAALEARVRHLESREATIIKALNQADCGQYRADIVTKIEMMQAEFAASKKEASDWKLVADGLDSAIATLRSERSLVERRLNVAIGRAEIAEHNLVKTEELLRRALTVEIPLLGRIGALESALIAEREMLKVELFLRNQAIAAWCEENEATSAALAAAESLVWRAVIERDQLMDLVEPAMRLIRDNEAVSKFMVTLKPFLDMLELRDVTKNFLTSEIQFIRDDQPWELTMQRVGGKTPSMRIKELEAELAALRTPDRGTLINREASASLALVDATAAYEEAQRKAPRLKKGPRAELMAKAEERLKKAAEEHAAAKAALVESEASK